MGMKYLKTYENYGDNQKTITLYRGSSFNPLDRDYIFLTNNINFAKSYGDKIYKIKIKPNKIFNSLNDEDMKMLFSWLDNGLYDEYNNVTYYSYDELEEKYPGYTSDTWEMIESEMELIESKGYDCAIITEGGSNLNYIIFDKNIIINCEEY